MYCVYFCDQQSPLQDLEESGTSKFYLIQPFLKYYKSNGINQTLTKSSRKGEIYNITDRISNGFQI